MTFFFYFLMLRKNGFVVPTILQYTVAGCYVVVMSCHTSKAEQITGF